MLTRFILRTLLIINLLSIISTSFAIEINDPCSTDVLRSYRVSNPKYLCSNPNEESFLFSIEGQGTSEGYYILKPNTSATLVEYTNGTCSLKIVVIMKYAPKKEYLVELVGSEPTFGKPTLDFTPALNYCVNLPTSGWTFYNHFKMTITGQGDNSGQIFTLISPQQNKHTFQIGYGANIWESNLGSGLWFDNANTQLNGLPTIKGDLQMSLTPIECCAKNICVPMIVTKTKHLSNKR